MTQETFLKARFVIFRCQKYVKKGTWKWQKKFTLRKCPGSLHFPLLLVSPDLTIKSDLILTNPIGEDGV